jgi:hypothetical protein
MPKGSSEQRRCRSIFLGPQHVFLFKCNVRIGNFHINVASGFLIDEPRFPVTVNEHVE